MKTNSSVKVVATKLAIHSLSKILSMRAAMKEVWAKRLSTAFSEEVPCSQCGHLNEVTGEVWEYPNGAVNLVQLT
ncbi:hypothetical protein [Paenibacillus sp. GCM10028914]|uniref:hypothetical protein n=1 Tax=Paenibacillus sp. GCM10028914 TaxID=3273416 RepID=UPI003614F09E